MALKALLPSQKLILKSLKKHKLRASVTRSPKGDILQIGPFWWDTKIEGLSRNPSHTTLEDLRKRRLITYEFTETTCTISLPSVKE